MGIAYSIAHCIYSRHDTTGSSCGLHKKKHLCDYMRSDTVQSSLTNNKAPATPFKAKRSQCCPDVSLDFLTWKRFFKKKTTSKILINITQ